MPAQAKRGGTVWLLPHGEREQRAQQRCKQELHRAGLNAYTAIIILVMGTIINIAMIITSS